MQLELIILVIRRYFCIAFDIACNQFAKQYTMNLSLINALALELVRKIGKGYVRRLAAAGCTPLTGTIVIQPPLLVILLQGWIPVQYNPCLIIRLLPAARPGGGPPFFRGLKIYRKMERKIARLEQFQFFFKKLRLLTW